MGEDRGEIQKYFPSAEGHRLEKKESKGVVVAGRVRRQADAQRLEHAMPRVVGS